MVTGFVVKASLPLNSIVKTDTYDSGNVAYIIKVFIYLYHYLKWKMKPKEYIEKTLKAFNDNGQTTCEDCGNASEISHAIVDHQDNTVKVVCDECFQSKYVDFLYSENGGGETH